MQRVLAHLATKPIRSVLALSLALLLIGNWLLPLLDRDEPRFAEASREMLRRKNPVVPYFNDRYRFDKPPLVYWCQAASYKVLGDHAFAARLPSAVFAGATALLLLFWGRRAGKEKAGLHAALMFVTCLQVLVIGRSSVADPPLFFFVALATWSGWEMTRPDNEERRWWWLFYLSLALGFLAKGPVAWLPLGGVLLGRWLRRQFFQLSLGSVLSGMGFALALIGLWGVPALLATRGEFLKVGIGYHVVARSVGILDGHGSGGPFGFILALPLYFLTFFLSFLPWGFRVPIVLRSWWKTRAADNLGWYLLLQAALVFGVFTLVRTKLPHYTLPAFPALAFWLALQLSSHKEADARIVRGVAGMAVLTAVLTLGVFPLLRSQLLATNLWESARTLVQPHTQMAVIQFREPSLVWEFRKVLTNRIDYLSSRQAVTFLQGEPPRLLVIPTGQLTEEIRNAAPNAVLLRARGREMAHVAKAWDVTAIVRP